MPLSEYSDSVGGGLKLKGVKDGRIKKHKKKDRQAVPIESTHTATEPDEQPVAKELEVAAEKESKNSIQHVGNTSANRYGKTEAQLRHEERKKQLVRESTTQMIQF